jgi:NAD(P)H-hydrate epimerase
MSSVNQPDTQYLLDREGARNLDRCAIEEFGIPGIELMENAAREACAAVRKHVPARSRLVILAGRGNNGGDGWAMARLLHGAGHDVRVHSLGAARAGSDAARNQKRTEALPIQRQSTLEAVDLKNVSLVVDALYGTGLDRPIDGVGADWIRQVNASTTPTILAVDLPSGLDADQGVPLGPTIQATRTVTFVAPKLGMLAETAARYCGSIDVVSIGTPDSLLKRFGVPAAG